MTFLHVIGTIALLVTVIVALNGALKAKGDVLTIVSFILIPLFAIAACVALTMPQEPGFSANELTMSIVVGVLGIATAVTNHVQTNREQKKLQQLWKGRK